MSKIIKQAIVMVALMWLIPISYAESEQSSSRMVFVSFSMPKESLKSIIREAKARHVPVVIRGLVNNSFKQTLASMKELMGENIGGIQLDPMLFREFKVTAVPAFVSKYQNGYDIIYGNVHIDYAFDEMRRRHHA